MTHDILKITSDWVHILLFVPAMAIIYLQGKRVAAVEERFGHIESLFEAKLDGLVLLNKGKTPIIDSASGEALAYIDFERHKITSAKTTVTETVDAVVEIVEVAK